MYAVYQAIQKFARLSADSLILRSFFLDELNDSMHMATKHKKDDFPSISSLCKFSINSSMKEYKKFPKEI